MKYFAVVLHKDRSEVLGYIEADSRKKAAEKLGLTVERDRPIEPIFSITAGEKTISVWLDELPELSDSHQLAGVIEKLSVGKDLLKEFGVDSPPDERAETSQPVSARPPWLRYHPDPRIKRVS